MAWDSFWDRDDTTREFFWILWSWAFRVTEINYSSFSKEAVKFMLLIILLLDESLFGEEEGLSLWILELDSNYNRDIIHEALFLLYGFIIAFISFLFYISFWGLKCTRNVNFIFSTNIYCTYINQRPWKKKIFYQSFVFNFYKQIQIVNSEWLSWKNITPTI